MQCGLILISVKASLFVSFLVMRRSCFHLLEILTLFSSSAFL